MSLRLVGSISLLSAALATITVSACECPGGGGPGGPGGPKKPIGEGCANVGECIAGAVCEGINGGDDACADPNDLDGDGTPNGVDPDIDGDGTPNGFDDDTDGDGTPNFNPDGTQADDTPFGDNNNDPDTCIGSQGDCDNDGLPNSVDPDDNGDQIPDGVDGIGSCDGGQSFADNESSDCDGFCLTAEGGYQACDDGGVPGAGVSDSDGDGIPDPLDDDDFGDGQQPPLIPPPVGEGEGEGEGVGPGEGEGEGEGEGQNCSDFTFNPGDDLLDPRIMLVVDKSGSMNDPDLSGARKWDGLRSALITVVGDLNDSVELGMVTYPTGDVCDEGNLRVGVQPNNATAIIDILENTEPAGGTPTAATLVEARQELEQLSADGGARAIVLATDGGPNCNNSLDGDTCNCVAGAGNCSNGNQLNCLDDTNAINAASQAAGAGIPVFVIGQRGTENFAFVLNGLAQAGGTAQGGATQFYQANDEAELVQDLRDIAIRVGACRVDLPQNVSAGQLTVRIDGVEIPQDTSRQGGWDLVDPNTVEFFGQECQDIVSGGGATATVGIQVCEG